MIAVEGFTVPEDIAEIWMGQDPANAPKASSVGAKLYIAATCGAYPF
ncbi:hypothetical protein [Fundidesulfovibrio magnetotacticus]|nr:hypothetical protein [Fundidesulfovibrio magnetotacticus]